MGLFTDILAVKRSFAADSKTAQLLTRYKEQLQDPAVPAAFAAADEVQEIAIVVGAGGGTFTVKITLRNGVTFTTAAIAYDANAATIEAAIDTASPASVTAGDIVVTGGPIGTDPIVLTYSGATVAGTKHPLAAVVSSITDGMDPIEGNPEVTETTSGQPVRLAWAVLKALGVIADTTPPEQDELAEATAGANLALVKPWFIRELAQEAAFEDDNKLSYDAIVSVLVPQDDAPLVV